MSKCKFEILAENENGYISMCHECQGFNFVFNNLLFTFTEENLFEFFDWIKENQYNPQHTFDLYHGKSHVFRSPVNNLFIAFDDEDMLQMDELFNEVKLLLNARRILGS